jgi:hypothetical protein
MPKTFTRKIVKHSDSVGSLLAAARQQADKTIEECSRRLAIPKRYLVALEQENLPALPGLIYEKNFIKRYAEFLRIRPQPLVKTWIGLRQGTEAPKPEFASRVHWWNFFQGPLLWRRMSIVSLVLLLSGYLGYQLVEMISPPQLVLNSPGVGQVVTKPDMSVKGTVAKSAVLEVNGQLVSTDDSGVFDVPIILEPGSNTIRAVAEKRYGKPAIIERQVFLAPRTNQYQRTSQNNTNETNL